MTTSQYITNGPIDSNGIWSRMPARFRNSIPSEHFPAEKNRYILYVNFCCPWAHRTILIHALKGLEDVIQLVQVDARDATHGWYFSGQRGPARDPIYGIRWLKELYLRADPQYNGRVTLPLLWDKQRETIVSNESSEIIRMFRDAFDEFLPLEKREATKGPNALVPSHLRSEIDALNAWVYDLINNGVYKTGFAATQAAYNEHVTRLFQALDRLEYHLSQNKHPFLFGDHITEADVRLYPTIVRFDVAYYTLFKCNLKQIRTDYPHLHLWLRRLYWDESAETNGVFKNTTSFECIKRGYSSVATGNGIIPIGPFPHIMPL